MAPAKEYTEASNSMKVAKLKCNQCNLISLNWKVSLVTALAKISHVLVSAQWDIASQFATKKKVAELAK